MTNLFRQAASMWKMRSAGAMAIAALAMLLAATAPCALGQTFTVLHSYSYYARDQGMNPAGTLELDPEGNLYGTTTGGGPPNQNLNGCGTVFKLDTTGGYNVLLGFNCGDGAIPVARLLLDAKGNLYGTTQHGGDLNCGGRSGCGTLFELTATGGFILLHMFEAGVDGAFPSGAVVEDKAGNLYGVTQGGGDPQCGCGNVFKVDASGQFSVLHSFTGTPDGASPYSGLEKDAAGNFYGTTQGGGTDGQGTVFKLDTTGKLSVLHNFKHSAEGVNPRSSLIRDGSGNLYGTTYYGGSANQGTVYKLDASGRLTVLHSFGTAPVDGSNPLRGVARDAAGNLYGVTPYGGAYGWGMVYKLDVAGNFTAVYSMTGGADGGYPEAGVALDAAGALYGVTFGGPNPLQYGFGVVFKITP